MWPLVVIFGTILTALAIGTVGTFFVRQAQDAQETPEEVLARACETEWSEQDEDDFIEYLGEFGDF